MALKSKLTNEDEIQAVIGQEEATQEQISKKRAEAKSFSIRTRSSDDTASVLESSAVSGAHSGTNNIRMSRMKPPKFSGGIRDFASFKGDFQTMVQSSYTDPVHQVYVMKQECLQGEALELVRNLNSLTDIWDRLSERYGDSIEIVDSVIKDLRSITIPRINQDQGLIHLIETLEKGIQDLTLIGKRDQIANASTVKLMEEKLPRRVLTKSYEEVQDGEEDTTSAPMDRFERLLLFLKKERRLTEKIAQQNKDKFKDNEKIVKDRKLNMFNKGGKKNGKCECLIHSDSTTHHTRRCPDYLQKTANERAKLVLEKSACKLCLSTTHVGKDCPWKSKWDPCGVGGCTEYHSRTLHGNTMINMHIQAAASKTNLNENSRTLLLIQEIPDGSDKALVFWDNGSMLSLVSKKYARERNLKGVKVCYDLTTVNHVTTPQHTMLYDIPIIDCKGEKTFIKAYEIEAICDEVALFDNHVTQLFKNLKIEDVARPNANVDLLIGSDHINIHPIKIRCNGRLALFKSFFGTGRVLGGCHPSLNNNGIDQINNLTKVVALGKAKNFRVMNPNKLIFDEDLGVSVPPRCNRCKNCPDCTFEAHQLSQNEQKELDVIRSYLKLDPCQNKYVTSYPFKVDPSTLPNNEVQADALLFKTEKQLLRNKAACDSYCEQFEDAIRRGVYKEITQEELDMYDGPVFYVTQHPVCKEESSSTPVRIVSNASLKFKGISLNDILMKGPNALSDLFCVQLNFRSYLVAAVGDIKKMYHSISTTIIERHVRRVKWRGMDLNVKPKIYGTETVQFGDKPATAITATAIKETADLFEYINSNAAEKIKNDSYVDDFATGNSTRESTDELTKNITKILAKGGFHIKGFIKSGDTSEERLSLLGTGDVGRVLGIGWSPPADEFSVIVRINLSKKYKGKRKSDDIQEEEIPALISEKLTRRIVLAVTNSIYDIYGFLVPVTIEMKLILRETHKRELKLGWDDDIPRELKEKWISVLKLLKEAESLRFRRCISYVNSVGDQE